MTSMVRSVARALDLIELLCCEPGGISLSRAAQRLAMPKSSTLMLLRTLSARGYANRTGADLYVLNPEFRAGAFGWRTVPYANLIAAVEPVLGRLAEELCESATFGILDEPGEARVLAKAMPDVEIRWDSDISRPIPLYCTAVGRALLSGLSTGERVRQLAARDIRPITPFTVTDPAELMAIIEEAARCGHAFSAEEFALGGTGIAAPVFDAANTLIGALNISCVSSRVQSKRESIFIALRQGTAEIGRRLGGEPPK